MINIDVLKELDLDMKSLFSQKGLQRVSQRVDLSYRLPLGVDE